MMDKFKILFIETRVVGFEMGPEAAFIRIVLGCHSVGLDNYTRPTNQPRLDFLV